MWVSTLLEDGHNKSMSSKRVVTLLAFMMCCWGFVADAYGYDINPDIFDAMMYIVVAGLGLTASEKFAPLNSKSKTNQGIL
jgi:hypothetical protein